jgi:hypothetical protein
MSAAGVELTRRSSRAVWAWCVAYTVLAPTAWRERRREELRSHLWESERAGQATRRVVRAALAGVASDLTWALGRGLPALGRSFGTTTPYLVVAAAFPIQAAFVSFFPEGSRTTLIVGSGAVGGVAALVAAGVVAVVQFVRSRR